MSGTFAIHSVDESQIPFTRLFFTSFFLYSKQLTIRGGVTVIDVENGLGDPSSNPGCDCISYKTNILEKGINLSNLSPAMNKRKKRLGFLALLWQLI